MGNSIKDQLRRAAEGDDNPRVTKTFNLAGYRGVEIESFALQGMTGLDEIEAGKLAENDADGASSTDWAIALCITHVDGEPVHQPYVAWRHWNSITRAFVAQAWQRLTQPTEGDVKRFLLEAFGPDEEDATEK